MVDFLKPFYTDLAFTSLFGKFSSFYTQKLFLEFHIFFLVSGERDLYIVKILQHIFHIT